MLRAERDRKFSPWLISAQPSRSVALLQEHDCPAQFIPNPKDYPAIDKLQNQRDSGSGEIFGPSRTRRLHPADLSHCRRDRSRVFWSAHVSDASYVRKRRRAASKQVDPNKLRPKDYVVHRNHGIGQFLRLESLTVDNETREYLVIQYADGLLRVAVDQMAALSRYRRR